MSNGPVKVHPGSRVRLTLENVVTTFDPTGSTIEVKVDDTWYAASWQGSPVVASGVWTQTAVTTGWFIGSDPSITPDQLVGADLLTAGRHLTHGRVTNGGQVVVFATAPIDVQD